MQQQQQQPPRAAGSAAGGGDGGGAPPAPAAAASSSDQHASMPAGAPSSRQFRLPVDAEHKATSLPLLSAARPHMRAFHLSWLALFTTFLTTFAPAALLPVLQDALNLTASDISAAGVASVCGTVASRIAVGGLCDALGPRYSAALTLLGTAPLMFGLALAQGAGAFIALRMLVGLGLSMFVVNQAWMNEMFNRRVLGRATALSAGWGNTGFGVALLLMPLLHGAFDNLWGPLVAWRAAFCVPAALQLLAGIAVLALTDDNPEGRLPEQRERWCCRPLVRSSQQPAASQPPAPLFSPPSSSGSGGCWPSYSWVGVRRVFFNPRLHLLGAAYAACFGVELTIANIVSLYLFNTFELGLTTAGLLGGSLGLMNIVSRFLGGAGSDWAAARRGMRGRMAALLVLLLLEGALCLIVGITHHRLAPTLVALYTCCFFGQMACGAVFAIVPFASHRCTGLAAGLVAAGGTVGSAVTQAVFFGPWFSLAVHDGFYWMGAAVICVGALSCLTLYFPMWGGICCAPDPSVTEEKFYLSEYSAAERATGVHLPALAFAHEAHRERDPRAARSGRQRSSSCRQEDGDGGLGAARRGCCCPWSLGGLLPGARRCWCCSGGSGGVGSSSDGESNGSLAPAASGGVQAGAAPPPHQQQSDKSVSMLAV